MGHKTPSGEENVSGQRSPVLPGVTLDFTLHLPLFCKFQPGLVRARCLALRRPQNQDLLLPLIIRSTNREQEVCLPWPPVQRGREKQVPKMWTLAWDCSYL